MVFAAPQMPQLRQIHTNAYLKAAAKTGMPIIQNPLSLTKPDDDAIRDMWYLLMKRVDVWTLVLHTYLLFVGNAWIMLSWNNLQR